MNVPTPVFRNFRLPVSAISVLTHASPSATAISSVPTCSAEFVTENALRPPARLAGSLRCPPFTSNTVPSLTAIVPVLSRSTVVPAGIVRLSAVSTNADGVTTPALQNAVYSAAVEKRTCMLVVTPSVQPVTSSPSCV